MKTVRQRFELSNEQLNRLLNASQSVAYIASQCGPISSPQEHANRVWQSLGEEMGFVWDTVEPSPGEGRQVFTAEKLQTLEGSGD